MGLLTDTFFIRALKSDAELIAMLPAGGVYNNVADPDYDMANVALPYIIVNNDGGDNQATNKDDEFEGTEDRVNISIRITAKSREELADMSLRVRETVCSFAKAALQRVIEGSAQKGDELCPYEYSFRFSDIAFDMEKPAHTMMLYYDCIVRNEIFND